ncbi:APC family permease [Idiomarina sp. HP20-50]|uniref:APC family permease n=1 Tax=Idiomarina sp. HP20-50 TaxID=3070813 RepID=UPI00294B677D|nr:APC family permease [Idiomarina sp. HP20-50]MDV6316714.1 APC family permease [Idiomarina sp. HP20-50]
MNQQLVRSTSLTGAIVLGLGSILGTGAFVSVGIGADIAGSAVMWAIVIAAMTALCNGLSSAQLASAHSVSGGTYEYGYRFLTPVYGVTAGSLFIVAKSASAATAALAVGWYVTNATAIPAFFAQWIAAVLLVLFTLLVLGGVKRTNWVNAAIVTVSITALLVFIVTGHQQTALIVEKPPVEWTKILQASALLFVAYTGYGRIATMGEEVQNPRQVIPLAVVSTLVVVTVLYLGVGSALLHFPSVDNFQAEHFSLASLLPEGPVKWLVILGAIVAMGGVMLNLILGVSRVVLAMGRRSDLPMRLSNLNNQQTAAPAATWLTCAVMLVLVAIGDIKTAWSFSAFTVLVYYGITNMAALKVTKSDRFVPKWVSIIGLVSCLGLAVFVPWQVLLSGIIFIVVVLLIHQLRR